MKHTRFWTLVFTALLLFCARLPASALDFFPEVRSDHGDYFLYGIYILCALVLIGLVIYVIIRRRR